jgi:hypothetical protein
VYSPFERFLQLAGDLVDRRLDLALDDLGGSGKRLVELWFESRRADHDEPCPVSQEFLGRLIQLLAGQSPAAEPLGDDAAVRVSSRLTTCGLPFSLSTTAAS